MIPPSIEQFRRLMDRMLFTHGEWVRRPKNNDAECERLADVATDAEEDVFQAYAAAFRGRTMEAPR